MVEGRPGTGIPTCCEQPPSGRLRAAGVTQVLDMTAGIGLDALAFAAAGMRVDAVEADPATAALAAANAEHLGQGRMRVFIGDCRNPEAPRSPAADAWFIDPARRTAVRGVQVSIGGSTTGVLVAAVVVGARAGGPGGVGSRSANADGQGRPGLPHEAIIEVPGTAVDAEWVSVSGQLLETCVTWRRCPDADASAPRRAAVVIDGSGDDAGLLDRVRAGPRRAPTPTSTGRRPPEPAPTRASICTTRTRPLCGRISSRNSQSQRVLN